MPTLATPRAIRALTGPKPRIIAGDVWAKRWWAGINLEPGDLPEHRGGGPYPIELSRSGGSGEGPRGTTERPVALAG